MRVKDAAAEYLAKAEGQFCSGEVLAAHLGVSRNAVWKAVRALQEEGYPIESRKRIGYRLVTDADLLTEEAVREYLDHKAIPVRDRSRRPAKTPTPPLPAGRKEESQHES